mmetsp:Transcript_4059/g.12818  ORF Transcript_4059/g.12818 Transcript_4059/m.12818 type:complete len:212 (+) Transcript_4059:279-914(+)
MKLAVVAALALSAAASVEAGRRSVRPITAEEWAEESDFCRQFGSTKKCIPHRFTENTGYAEIDQRRCIWDDSVKTCISRWNDPNRIGNRHPQTWKEWLANKAKCRVMDDDKDSCKAMAEPNGRSSCRWERPLCKPYFRPPKTGEPTASPTTLTPSASPTKAPITSYERYDLDVEYCETITSEKPCKIDTRCAWRSKECIPKFDYRPVKGNP